MILMNDNLRVALVTGHIPLAQVASKITVEDIVSKLRIFNQSLKQDFGIVRPRIAVLSLNPHAGDAGLLGKEEEEIIIPAIQEAEKRGVMNFCKDRSRRDRCGFGIALDKRAFGDRQTGREWGRPVPGC